MRRRTNNVSRRFRGPKKACCRRSIATLRRYRRPSMMVSSVNDFTSNIDGYHIYLFKDSAFEGVAKDLISNFQDYARRIGDNSVIITSTNSESYIKSLKSVFSRDEWFSITIGDVTELPAGLFITRPSVQKFRCNDGDVFIYVSQVVINDAFENPADLSQEIADLCRNYSNDFIKHILPYSRGAIVNTTPKNNRILNIIKDSIIIQPNFNGIGIDINLIMSKKYKKFKKKKSSTLIYDCVVYRY